MADNAYLIHGFFTAGGGFDCVAFADTAQKQPILESLVCKLSSDVLFAMFGFFQAKPPLKFNVWFLF